MQILQALNSTQQSKLNKLNLHTYWDLALHIPLRYEDLTKIYPIASIQIGQIGMVEGQVIAHEIIHKKRKQLIVRIDDGSAIINLLFFHFFPNYAQQFTAGRRLRAHGEIKADFFGNKTIIHPKIQNINNDEQKLDNTFTPIYPTTNGLANKSLIQLVDNLFTLDLIPETLPAKIIHQYNLLSLEQALLSLHKLTPAQFAANYQVKALQRLKFDELIAQQLLMQNIYQHKHQHHAPSMPSTHKLTAILLANLPFKLTKAQTRVTKEILQNMCHTQQMNRLLQGDVGSGKTIIALISALVAIENGYQAVIMAPTEILAEQHYLKAQHLLAKLNLTIICLTGSLTNKNKLAAYTTCANGTAQLIIGTHAIFQKDVMFKQLGLVIIDEQHRFGVEQRLSLLNKGTTDIHPHQLMMSATPIPRSLAMSYYADLDISTIDELPPNRTPIKTLLINNNRRHEIINYIQEHIKLGKQVYWVCPLIEESEKLDLENAINTFNELSSTLTSLNIGLIHGRLKTKEKTCIMHDFTANKLQVLVATTVIEVGVDVPNASIMIIEHSERMGLAQLHQLRGRIGRGSNASVCILLYDMIMSDLAKQRLKVITNSNDGFVIAREDLLIRGPGELLGARQSGLPALRFANLEADLNILTAAKDIANELINIYPELAKQLVELWFYNKQIYARC